MQIKSLRYFNELARTGSFYAAAKVLMISQQGLSKAISSLEAELGLKLVERSRKGVRLTREGEVLLGHSERIVAGYDAALADLYAVQRSESEEDGRVLVHVSYYSAQIASFDPVYIGMLAGDTAYIEEPFEKLTMRAAGSDGSDLVFLDLHPYSAPKIKSDPGVVFDKVLSTRYGLVWKDGSPLAGSARIHREQACGLPFALNTSREIASLADWIFEGFPLDVHMGATNPRMLLEYVRQSSNGAVALFDSFAFYLAARHAPELADDLHFTPLSTPKSICEMGFLYPKKAKLTLRAQSTVAVLRRHLEGTCADYEVDASW